MTEPTQQPLSQPIENTSVVSESSVQSDPTQQSQAPPYSEVQSDAAAHPNPVEITGRGDDQNAPGSSPPLPNPYSNPPSSSLLGESLQTSQYFPEAEQAAPSPPTPELPPRPEVLEHEYEPHMSDDNSIEEVHVPHEGIAVQSREPEVNAQVSPEVATLKAMFPDFDDMVLQSVLESVGGNPDRAIDILLGMSDPSYVSSHPPQPVSPEPTTNSTDLDEQLARQLALDDEREQQDRRSRRQQATGHTWDRRTQGRQPGQVPPTQPQDPNAEPDFSQQAQETFTRLAESGKRTFSSIVSKVKAKINEFDQKGQQQQGQPPRPDANYRVTSSGVRTQSGAPVDRHSASEAFSSQYYGTDPRLQRQSVPIGLGDDWEDVTGGWSGRAPTATTAPAPVPVPQPVVRGYDVDEDVPVRSSSIRNIPQQPARTPSPVLPTPAVPSSPQPRGSMSDIPPPPPTNSGTIDAAKIGFLPRRPVSLSLGPTSPKPAHHSDSEDELEYAENPFDDH